MSPFSDNILLSPVVLCSALVGLILWLVRPLFLLYMKHRERVKCLKQFPSLHRHWLYGTVKQLKSGPAFFDMHQERVNKYPHCYTVWLGPFPQLNMHHPDAIKPVLKLSDPKHVIYDRFLKPWLGEGLLIASGEKWFRSRRLLTPAFHFDVLKSYIKVYNEATEIFLGKIATLVEDGSGTFEVFNHISLLTLDIILKCAFSFETNCQSMGRRHPYVKAVYELTGLFNTRMSKVLDRMLPFAFWFTKEGKRFCQLTDIIHEQADTVIRGRKEQLDQHGEIILAERKYLDFLDILLTAKDEDGNGMNPKDVRAEVDTFLFEGHDTTSSGLSWTLYALACNPDCQRRAQYEIDAIIKDRESPDTLWEDLPKLQYTSQCLKESLRLYCPVPMVGRMLTRDIEVMGNRVPAGTSVIIAIWALHHNPAVWGQDHLTYDPERFSTENLKSRDPYAFLPFSAGPRNCIGQSFAMNEEKVVLARLLQRYTFEVADDCPKVEPIMTLVMRSQQDIRLRAIPR